MNNQPHKPRWFKDNEILIINAPTCGINKDGVTQYKVGKDGTRSETEIDDKLSDVVKSICQTHSLPHIMNIRPRARLLTARYGFHNFMTNQANEPLMSFLKV